MPSRRQFLKQSAALASLPALPAVLALPGSRPDEADFISLFDGETLAGWHKNPEKIWHGTGGRWVVEDGAIAGEQDPPSSGNGGILLSDRKFGDFELLLEIKPDFGIDSGLFLRATDKGEGFQMMIDYLNGGVVGQLYGENIGGFGAASVRLRGTTDAAGALTRLDAEANPNNVENPMTYAISPEDWLKAWKINDWNRVRIVCVGDYPIIKVWIDDALVTDFNASTFTHPNYDREKTRATLGREGSIALQVHGGADRWATGAKSRWRNIRVREL
ncbi:MAG: family 16 glycoside hydrolase [Rhodothermales bacterium]|nr:family 16 glycoside hydrolase [Rhodothermales bacterium]